MPPVPQYYSQGREEMAAFVPARRHRVLEIGCGEGVFLSRLPGVDESWGIEPSTAAAMARGRLHRVLQATFDAAEPKLPVGYFDVIICNDVIEHMPDHDSFFARIGHYLAPGGVIVGSIPNVRFYQNMFEMLFEKDWHYRSAGILDRTHLRFFTEKSLKKCLQDHGLTVNTFCGLVTNIPPPAGRSRTYYWMSRLLIGATFGYFSDIRYLQFAFQASPDSVPPGT